MAVVAKAVIKTYYGRGPSSSYWNGCSMGGRQGLVEAQMYPNDYDGILAAASAVSIPCFAMAIQWPYTVMIQDKYIPSQCEFTAFITSVLRSVMDWMELSMASLAISKTVLSIHTA
jgi:hypothetical protein